MSNQTDTASMSEEQRNWYIGLSVIIGLALGVAFALEIRKFYNAPVRKAERKRRKLQNDVEKDIDRMNSVNLNGCSITKLARTSGKVFTTKNLYTEYKAIQRRTLEKTKYYCQDSYKNISNKNVPFEHNRVKLLNEESDYINASWIENSASQTMFIAAQVPLRLTIDSFWKMVWDNGVHVIVMIGEQIRHIKVTDYLEPDSIISIPPKYTFLILKTQQFNEYILRTISLQSEDKNILIYHLQIVTWTVAASPTPQLLLEVRRQMKDIQRRTGGPILVHCVTGCGRTGTLIALDNLCGAVDEAKFRRQDTQISWAHEVVRMRELRLQAVANVSQYCLLYDTLCHYIVGGVTSLPVDQLGRAMHFYSAALDSNKTRFQKQFEDCTNMTRSLRNADCAGAIRQENLHKNRDILVVPRDANRPYLKKDFSKVVSDYINAVYVDSFNKKNCFLVVQWPLKSTINDTWRIIYEKNINVLVILNSPDGKKYPQFVSNILHQKFGSDKLSVELSKDWLHSNSVRCQLFNLAKPLYRLPDQDRKKLAKLNIKVIESHMVVESRTVIVLHLLNWRENKDVPNSTSDFIELIWLAKVLNMKMSNDLLCESSIMIMSRDGYKRAGVFCATTFCLEQIHNCGEVDIYNTVLTVKRNRPKLVTNITEYMLIYELCLEYLKWSESENYKRDPLSEFIIGQTNKIMDNQ